MNFYLSKYGFADPQIKIQPEADLKMVVVIPCFNESGLISSLTALNNCEKPSCSVEVIIVVNSGEHHDLDILEVNRQTIREFQEWEPANDQIRFFLIHQSGLPKKHAGVGLARKIGMDEAVARLDTVNKDGIIICFDADSACDPNYLVEIEKHFESYPKTPGCSIYFEHPLEGEEFEPDVYSGIIHYELHLRYYKQALLFCGLPYAFHTVGSSMAVRSSAYQKQGGMNKRKAGEDFYFIHKIISLGNFTRLSSTRVIPSPRVSDRVPFGTGKAIGDWLESDKACFKTYSYSSFVEIKKFIEQLPFMYRDIKRIDELMLHEVFGEWLETNNFLDHLQAIRKNTSSFQAFKKRFFVWFDAFKVLKLVHHFRDNCFPNEEITESCSRIFEGERRQTAKNWLLTLRAADRKNNSPN